MTKASKLAKQELRALMDSNPVLRECGMKLEIKDGEVFVLVSHPHTIDLMIVHRYPSKAAKDIYATINKFFPKTRRRGRRAVTIANPIGKRFQYEIDSVRANG